MHEYEDKLVTSKELKDLTSLISETNKKLVMKFKREHQYTLEKYEE